MVKDTVDMDMGAVHRDSRVLDRVGNATAIHSGCLQGHPGQLPEALVLVPQEDCLLDPQR